MLEFACAVGHRSWTGKIEIMHPGDDLWELVVTGDGNRFHLLVGNYAYGSFLCIPRLGISCELASLCDLFWNRESIGRHFNSFDTETLVLAISKLA
jgi:hypothetical protein